MVSQPQSAVPDEETAEYIAQWTALPHPLEAAVLTEVNTPSEAAHRAADLIHRRPPGVDGPTRPVWVLARCEPSGETSRQQVADWCWYATRQAATTAQTRCGGRIGSVVLHETAVPRSVRCDEVEAFLARHYRAGSAQPGV